MRTVDEVFAQLAQQARESRSSVVFVAWRTRFDASYQPDLGVVTWAVNGKQVSEATAKTALQRARANQPIT